MGWRSWCSATSSMFSAIDEEPDPKPHDRACSPPTAACYRSTSGPHSLSVRNAPALAPRTRRASLDPNRRGGEAACPSRAEIRYLVGPSGRR
jgi:hypothetical protein